ncbi:MAG TPA: chemotaxis protein CheW [Polyangiaceae bacterium]
MSDVRESRLRSAEELKAEFDGAFARAIDAEDARRRTEDFLAITVDEDRYVLRISEIAGLYVDRKIVPLIRERRALLGLASFRNVLAPVYDLRVLLGHSPHAPPRWFVLVRAAEPVALAFDGLEAQIRVDVANVTADVAATDRFVAGAVAFEGKTRPLVAMTSVLAALGDASESERTSR